MNEDYYTVVSLDKRNMQKILNIYARQGYKFIQAINVEGEGIKLIFKNP